MLRRQENGVYNKEELVFFGREFTAMSPFNEGRPSNQPWFT